ncbi:Rieske (2Fe-2S) protein [Nocardiopsis ansamitocini]|uniref:Cytochrome bc1 complex Rieske iron-sulfur subunit n=1 Tax=Nocardiopsis ansamitocini TaxID=1670832 RepID=A0A9W6P3X4_9ACTN|nr:Rieske (2Fe-2S) protein [Nocardiopsis ansamitocini]GLU46644.1 iron-sulfur protein [Nocardiopsis ansamitocini]
MTDDRYTWTCSSRRTAFAVAGGTVVAGVLAGCGTEETPEQESGRQDSPSPEGDGGAGGTPLAQVDDIPVGGGTVFTDEKVVITQPEAGTILAFSALCTHQQCPVSEVADGTIICPCHDSKFSIADGSVTSGPAPSPLPEVEITVEGDTITLA